MKTIETNENALMRSRALAVLFSLLISALIMLPLFTMAKGNETAPNGKVYMYASKNNAHATITLADFTDGKHSLTIESEDGSSLYYNAMVESPKAFSKVFDLTRLEDGVYTVKVSAKRNVVVREFEVKNGKVLVNNAVPTAPVFRSMGEKAVVLYPNASNNSVSIRILSPMGDELLYTNVNESVKKVFDFSNLSNGNYKVIVSTGNQNYAFDYTK